MQQKIVPAVVFAGLLTLVAQTHAAFLEGIDVSHWQGNINWNSVKNDGVEFAFAKATEGVNFIDSKYVQNMNNASAAGVPIGPYHFARPDSGESNPLDAANEANDFVDAIEPYYQTPGQFLRPVLDVERLPDAGDIPGGTTQKAFLSEWIRDFIAVVESRLGFAPLIYANSNYANNYFESDLSQYDLWIARWTHNQSNPPTPANLGIWSEWVFWQWTDNWSVTGIAGAVDGNVFDGTVQDLMPYVVGAEPSADYDADGDVDGDDLLLWQRGGSPNPFSASDLALWKTNYGSLVPLSSTTAVVPEPATGIGLLCGMITMLFRRGRPSKANQKSPN